MEGDGANHAARQRHRCPYRAPAPQSGCRRGRQADSHRARRRLHAARRRTVIRWWRSHTLRVRLTLWYVAAMVVVLGVYVVAVYAFLQRDMLGALDEQLRRDLGWAGATVDYTAEGGFEWTDPEIVVGGDAP